MAPQYRGKTQGKARQGKARQDVFALSLLPSTVSSITRDFTRTSRDSRIITHHTYTRHTPMYIVAYTYYPIFPYPILAYTNGSHRQGFRSLAQVVELWFLVAHLYTNRTSKHFILLSIDWIPSVCVRTKIDRERERKREREERTCVDVVWTKFAWWAWVEVVEEERGHAQRL